MHIEHVDVLRCLREHEDSWLVAAIGEMDAREIVRGTLGCPVCSAEYRVERREVQMGGSPTASVDTPAADDVMRLAAILDLAEAEGLVLLAGRWGAYAPPLRAMLEQRLLLLSPPANVATDVGVYVLLAPPDALPLAQGTLRAIVLDELHADLAPRAARVLRVGGRLVAPVETSVPPEVKELARDDELWVAERAAALRLVGLERR